VKLTFTSCYALHQQSGVPVNEDTHKQVSQATISSKLPDQQQFGPLLPFIFLYRLFA